MKKHNKFLFVIAAFLMLSGCYDLDRFPADQPSSGTFWKNEDQVKQGVIGVYEALKNTDLFGKMFLIETNTDLAVGYDQYDALSLGNCTSHTAFLNGKWQNGYDAVMRANNAIRNIAKTTLPDDKKALYIGEAKFLRALFYFHLSDYFGGVPLYDENVVLESEFDKLMKPRSTQEEVRNFILKDLTDAINSPLPDKWVTPNYGRVTKGAIYALRGKVYLYAKNYEKALSDFTEATNAKYGFALQSNFAEIFTPKGHNGTEMIFAIQNKGGVGMPYGMPLCFYAGTRSSFGSCWNNTVPSTTLADMYECTDGKPFNWNDFIPGFNENTAVKDKAFRVTVNTELNKVTAEPTEAATIRDMYTKRDPRLTATIIAPYTQYMGWNANAPKSMNFVFAKRPNGSVATLNENNGFIRNNKGWESYFWRKFIPEADWNGTITDRAHTPVNFPLIRLADVYLMMAECYNEMNDMTNAVIYINKVRQRVSVNMPAINSGPAWLEARSKTEVFNRICRERAFELAGEGIRDSDLRRWKMSEKLLNKDEFGITGKRMLTRKFDANRDYLWPIPATEIELNPALTQNPNW